MRACGGNRRDRDGESRDGDHPRRAAPDRGPRRRPHVSATAGVRGDDGAREPDDRVPLPRRVQLLRGCPRDARGSTTGRRSRRAPRTRPRTTTRSSRPTSAARWGTRRCARPSRPDRPPGVRGRRLSPLARISHQLSSRGRGAPGSDAAPALESRSGSARRRDAASKIRPAPGAIDPRARRARPRACPPPA